MKENSVKIINQIKKDIADSGQAVDENQIQIFNIIRDAERVNYKKGAVIVKEGEAGENVFFLASGFIKIYRDIGLKRLFMNIMKPGDFLGFGFCGKIKLFPYSLVALENSIVYQISKEAVKRELYREPIVTQWVINNLADSMLAYYNKTTFLSSKNMHGRVASVILKFSDEIFKKDIYKLPITKKQLGHYANVSPENVTRIMKSFVKDNVIGVKGREIQIINKNNLKQFSDAIS